MDNKSLDRTIKSGVRYPFHRKTPETSAEIAATAVLYDMSDRRGIKWALEEMDDDVRAELVATMAALIDRVYKTAGSK